MTDEDYSQTQATTETEYAPTGQTFMHPSHARIVKKMINRAMKQRLQKHVKSRLRTRVKRQYSS
jgi:hypothetical protein